MLTSEANVDFHIFWSQIHLEDVSTCSTQSNGFSNQVHLDQEHVSIEDLR